MRLYKADHSPYEGVILSATTDLRGLVLSGDPGTGVNPSDRAEDPSLRSG